MEEKTTYEIHKERMMELGIAMIAYLTGKELHANQVKLINGATAEQKNLALELVAASYLKGKEYTTYCKNKKRILKKEEE